MGLSYCDLDAATRFLMIEEMAADARAGKLYLSKRLTTRGERLWPSLLDEAIREGDDVSLARALRAEGSLEAFEVAHLRGGSSRRRVPVNAADMLAEGEFNRFYCRAVCRRAIDDGDGTVEVYRAKRVSRPRPASRRLLGTEVDGSRRLHDLRTNIGIETALGVPGGPNSGLSVRLPSDGAGGIA